MSPPPHAPAVRGGISSPAWREAAGLLAVAVLLAAGSWLTRAPRLPLRADMTAYAQDLGHPVLSPAAALALYRDNAALLVDTRAGAAHAATRVPGALVIREASFDDDLLALHDFLAPEDRLVLYGDGDLQVLAAVAARLAHRGFANLDLMRGDLAAWHAAGGPLSAAGPGAAGPAADAPAAAPSESGAPGAQEATTQGEDGHE